MYYNYNPATVGFFPSCPSRTLTGLLCPGCGSQRALHELLHFNIGAAMRYNPLMVISIPYVAAGFIFNSKKVKRKFPKLRNFLFGYHAVIVVLVIVLAYAVIRNL